MAHTLTLFSLAMDVGAASAAAVAALKKIVSGDVSPSAAASSLADGGFEGVAGRSPSPSSFPLLEFFFCQAAAALTIFCFFCVSLFLSPIVATLSEDDKVRERMQ